MEGTFVLLLFFAFLFAVVDAGQVVVAHQSLVERTRGALRWAVVHPFDGTGEQIANLVLYNQPNEPLSSIEGYMGLSRENIRVQYLSRSNARPDDELVSVQIVNYKQRFISPWFPDGLLNPRPVAMSAAMAYQAAQTAPVR